MFQHHCQATKNALILAQSKLPSPVNGCTATACQFGSNNVEENSEYEAYKRNDYYRNRTIRIRLPLGFFFFHI
jgi:hypothetical protein